MSSALLDRLEAIRQILMAHHAAGAPFPSAAKGNERETLIREFFSKVQPNPTRFGCGSIIDSSGNQSGQLDVVAEFPFFPSFPTPGANERMYLAESVSFAVEVKSNLSKQWDEVEATTKKVRLLRRIWQGHIAIPQSGRLAIHDRTTSRIPMVVVSFEGPKEAAALEKDLTSIPEGSRPDAVLVIKSGAYFSELTGRQGGGAGGLLALCADMTYFVMNVLSAQPNLDGYFKGENG